MPVDPPLADDHSNIVVAQFHSRCVPDLEHVRNQIDTLYVPTLFAAPYAGFGVSEEGHKSELDRLAHSTTFSSELDK